MTSKHLSMTLITNVVTVVAGRKEINTVKKSFEKVFINRDGNPIKVKIVSLKSILTKEQYQSIYHLVTTNTRWYMDNYSGEYYGYANIEKAPGCEKLLFNKIELKDHVWGEGDKLLAATIYCEIC